MVTGFLAPDHGSVTIAGHDTIDQPAAARQLIGYLPESSPCYPEMRAIDYLIYRGRLQGASRRDAKQAAHRAAEQCRLEPTMSRKRIGALSKGYRQRVGLAASIVHDPKVLVLDEPTNGLDPAQIRDARNLIKDLAQSRSMLVSSHILPEIERTCDRVLMIVGGTIRADGSPAELAAKLPTRIHLEYRPKNDPDTVPGMIRQVAGIQSVQTSSLPENWNRLDAEASGDAHDRVTDALYRAGVQIRSLTAMQPTLEDVFVHRMDAVTAGEVTT